MAAKNRYDALPVRNLGQLLRRSVESRDRPSDHPPHPHTGLRLHSTFNSHWCSIEITILTKISEIFEAKTIQVWENAMYTFVQKHIDSLDRFYKMKQSWNRCARVETLRAKCVKSFEQTYVSVIVCILIRFIFLFYAGLLVHLKIAPNAPFAFSEISICICYYSRQILFKFVFCNKFPKVTLLRWDGCCGHCHCHCSDGAVQVSSLLSAVRRRQPYYVETSSARTRSITGLPSSADHRRRICKRGLCE